MAQPQGGRQYPPLVLGTLPLLMLLLLPQVAGGGANSPQPLGTEKQHVETAAQTLASKYDIETGLFRGTGWWNSANGISALARVGRALNTTRFDSIFQNTFVAAQRKNPHFLNEFYDDEGWWALAWLDVHELKGDARYLEISASIFDDMSHGWSDACGGGIWWKKNEHYKNAIANELFLSTAVRLAAATSGSARRLYLDWAEREERWFLTSGMINSVGLINDGLDASCQNNKGTTWTYNQGVILTGLSGLSELTHNPAPLRLANRIVRAVSSQLVDSHGVLHDQCEPDCGEDGIQFKGILMRNLASVQPSPPLPEISKLIENNAASVWDNARTADGQFSVNWAGPPRDSGTGSLIAALDALTAPLASEHGGHSRRLQTGKRAAR
jgi:predicted alpha-1,6-mannanase (GH76 family)